MADNKIVTKKTAGKPAAPADTRPAAATASKKIAAKRAAAEPKSQTPSASSHQGTHPAAPVMTKAGAAAAAAAKVATPAPAPASAAAKKVVAKKAEPAAPTTAAAPVPNPLPPLEEKPVSLQHLAKVTPEHRQDMIREAAYYKAEKRNFTGGNDAQDWADAEREIDELLAKARQIYGG